MEQFLGGKPFGKGLWCLVPNCYNKRKFTNTVFFSLPKEKSRCDSWLINCGRKDLLNMKLGGGYVMCAQHFDENSFMDPLHKKLKPNAVPTIFPRSEGGSLALPLLSVTGGKITDSKRFWCTICDKSFQLKDDLRKHLPSHSKKKFLCAVCGKMYKTVCYGKDHMRAHTTVRPFVCTFCDKGFKSRSGLKVHVRTHTNDYPYSCNYCECRFGEKRILANHTRTHTGEKPFSCKRCGRSFATHGTMRRHLRAKVPCTAQRKTKKSKNVAVTSIVPVQVYENNQPNAVDTIKEVEVATTQSTSDSFPNLASAEGQQYIIVSGDDQEILSRTPQIDLIGTIPVSDFEGLNSGSYIIISQSDGASDSVVAEFPIENVTFVPESEAGEDIVLNNNEM